ncbi:MAG TPA: hypothetical protein VNA87_01945, partial [Actinomycetota bacterium]|nr:hypothetical protein [Actinomycetota bacterium]
FLSSVEVVAGQDVERGFVIGLSGDGHPDESSPGLHFGVRFHDRYLDPMLLLLGRLDDVSDLIALAPLEGYEGPGFEGGGSKLLAPVAAVRSPQSGFFSRIGKGISGLFSSAARLPSKLFNGGKSLLSSIWSGGESVIRAVGAGLKATGSRILDALKVARSFAGATWRALVKAGRAVISAVSSAVRAAMGWLRDRVVAVTGWITSFFSKIWGAVTRGMKALWSGLVKVVTTSTPFRLGAGVVKERQCRKQGGGVAHNIPSVDEMKAGAKPPPPPNDNIVVAVAGIGSHTDESPSGEIKPAASIYDTDFRTLGYPEENIFHFSYEGIKDRGGTGPYRMHAPYEKEDTYEDIEVSAKKLALQIEEIHRRYPDKEIDIVAHSQGGLVSAQYIYAIWDAKRPDGPKLGHFVTISTPHQGADAAGLGHLLKASPVGERKLATLKGISRLTGLPDPASPSALQMAEGSGFIGDLNRNWDPGKVDTTTIGATFDFVVTPQHAHLKGARTYTADIPWKTSPIKAHSEVTTAKSTKQIVYGALANKPVQCTAMRDAVANAGVGPGLSLVVDSLVLVIAAVI